MKKKSLQTKELIEQQAKENQNSSAKKNNTIEDTKAMEKIFSGSCNHSGIHTYIPKERN